MGRASKWFRGLLGFKRSDPNSDPAHKHSSKKKRWSFSKRKDRHKSHHGVAQGGYADDDDASRHAIAVATATAAAAEAAVAAAHAAAAVVHLTSGGGYDRQTTYGADYWILEERAAVVIQTHFRAYLSRRALRALRALVKLQALVRGHILRKHNVEKLQQMQALVRVQARARAGSSSESPKPSCFNHAGRASQEKVHRVMKHEQPMMPKRRASSNSSIAYDPDKSPRERRKGETLCEQGGSFTRIVHVDEEKSDKILEVDTGKTNMTPKRRNIFHSSHLSQSSDQYCQSFNPSKEAASQTCLSPSSGEVQSPTPFYTAANSPLYYSVSSMDGISSKRAPSTPAKSDGSRSYQSNYSDHPSYMAYTESSKAKARSLSAPKQRPQWERSSSVNRYSVQGFGDNMRQKCSTLHANFSTKAYPGSGRLDRLGIPAKDAAVGFSSGLWHRY